MKPYSAQPASFRGFSEDSLGFLHALAFNNERSWFDAHRDEYERFILEPALALIREMEPVIRGISPHYTAVPKRIGGSLMRVYRDTRFGADKTPYKTNVGIQFRHESYRDVHAPGLYVHFSLEECFAGAGCWRPEREDLRRIRLAVTERPREYLAAVESARPVMQCAGDSLKRIPRGYEADHPLAVELKRLDFLLSAGLEPGDFLSGGLVGILAGKFEAAAPYMRFLCSALALPF